MKKIFLTMVAVSLLALSSGCSSHTREDADRRIEEFLAMQEAVSEEKQAPIYADVSIHWDLKENLKSCRAIEDLCRLYNEFYFARLSGFSLKDMNEVRVNDYTTEWYCNYNESSTLKCTDEDGFLFIEAYHWDENALSDNDKDDLCESFRNEAISLFGDQAVISDDGRTVEYDGKVLTFDVFESNMLKLTIQ